MDDLSTFKQSKSRHYVWVFIATMAVVYTVIGAAEINFRAMLDNIFILLGVLWVDALEKHVSKINTEKAAKPKEQIEEIV